MSRLQRSVVGLALAVATVLPACGGSGGSDATVTTDQGDRETEHQAESTTTTTSPAGALNLEATPLPTGWPADLAPPDGCVVVASIPGSGGPGQALGATCVLLDGDVDSALSGMSASLEAAGFADIEPITHDDPPAAKIKASRDGQDFSASIVDGSVPVLGDDREPLPGTDGDEGAMVTMSVTVA